MILVSVIYEVAEITCEICRKYHVAVIETDMIDWGDKKEIRHIEEVECPHCNKMTKVER